MDDISSRIKYVRKEWKLSQVEFAKRLGVTNAHISAIEKGKNSPSQALIKLISKEFKISEHWLSTGEGPKDLEDVLEQIEDAMSSAAKKLNKVMTRDDALIRSRVAPLQGLFVNIIESGNVPYDENIKYLDICYKLFFHIDSYLSFKKKFLESAQQCVLAYPDDLLTNLKRDIEEFEEYFSKIYK